MFLRRETNSKENVVLFKFKFFFMNMEIAMSFEAVKLR